MDLFRSIKDSNGFKPDEILYNCLLDACVATKNMKEAINLLNEMKKDP